MQQSLGLVSIVVRNYDEALAFYVGVLGFTLIEDTQIPEELKRWVVVAPPGSQESRLLLAQASNDEQARHIGNQTGGRVFLFLYTDNIARDFHSYKAKGVEFVREPKEQLYGTVAVFKDIYGNLWDLLQPKLVVVSAAAQSSAANSICGQHRSILGHLQTPPGSGRWGILRSGI